MIRVSGRAPPHPFKTKRSVQDGSPLKDHSLPPSCSVPQHPGTTAPKVEGPGASLTTSPCLPCSDRLIIPAALRAGRQGRAWEETGMVVGQMRPHSTIDRHVLIKRFSPSGFDPAPKQTNCFGAFQCFSLQPYKKVSTINSY